MAEPEGSMAKRDFGSLTKEPPLATLDATIRAIMPGMSYSSLLDYARTSTHKDAPGLISRRFLLLNQDGTINYDHFLSLAAAHGLEKPLVRKVMYFLWAYRDERIRGFVTDVIADTSGRWRVNRLVDKAQGRYFERWVAPSTATKARSNFEFFLAETKIYDPRTRTIHLELDDGWLNEAAIAAAQHEDDVFAREELLANPARYLEKRGWIGLLNAARSEIPDTSTILVSDAVPRQDDELNVGPSDQRTEKEWDGKSPLSSGKKQTTVTIDLVARERASKSHRALEEMLAAAAKRNNVVPKCNQNIDMYFESPEGAVLAEIKSCTDTNFHSQLRKGVSQLFEYRFLYRTLFKSQVTLLLLVETVPPKTKRWLMAYAESIGIILAWKEPSSGAIVTGASTLPETLSGIVTKIHM
jgi:hypothetical protein